eukprot:c24432_g1_i1 orf=278-2287(-)
MALVFKVKFEDTLRRWVAPQGTEALNADSFTITFGQLEAKIRELFHFSPATSLVITYLDKDNDVVTIADDQDLVDACVIQRLNPLRLDIQVFGGNSSPSEHAHAREQPRSSEAPPMTAENVNIEAFLNALFPQATAEAVKGFMATYTPFIDPKFPGPALGKVENAFKDFLNGLAPNQHGHRKFGEKGAPSHPKKHPCPAMAGFHHPHHGGGNFHWAIVCDGCGMTPIEGPRYKSTKESNYDLCTNCFKTVGNENDYEKIDRPAHYLPPHGQYRPPCFRKGGPKPFMAPPPGSRASFARGSYGWKPNHPFAGHQWSSFAAGDEHGKLDARFVKDVTIFDGTELSPGTKFTKIWRMSNIGTLPWPQSTQLVHIGGDVLSTEETVAVELPEGGLPCGEEVEVSADLVAPEKAGRYVSHWRLTAPSGQKFGHRVWVVIHVVPQGEHSPQFQASLGDGENSGEANKEAMDVDLRGAANTVTMDVDVDGANKVVVDVVIDGDTAGIEQVSVSKSGLNGHENAENTIMYPDPTSDDVKMDASNAKEIDGFSLVEKPTENMGWFDGSNHGETFHTPEGRNEGMAEEAEHETLLQALASMGFMDRDINLSILRSRNFELQGAVEDLLAAAGWDGALKDLEEMGFSDKATNIRMLVKNKGSLKQTVRDLVKLEKEVVQG